MGSVWKVSPAVFTESGNGSVSLDIVRKLGNLIPFVYCFAQSEAWMLNIGSVNGSLALECLYISSFESLNFLVNMNLN